MAICKVCGARANSSRCFRHKVKAPLKKSALKARKKSIRKVSKKGIIKKQEKKELLLKDWEFYISIWDNRPHICYEIGVWLGNEPNICYFHHILPKSQYPQYRHCDWNIVLLDKDIHNQVEMNISKCPRVATLTKELKDKYGSKQRNDNYRW